MVDFLFKSLVILMFFIGEGLSIYAEMVVAKNISKNSKWSNFLKRFGLITIGGIFLIFGFLIGYTFFDNVWILSIASITAILIIEPILIWIHFKKKPSIGQASGFLLGVIGLLLPLIFK